MSDSSGFPGNCSAANANYSAEPSEEGFSAAALSTNTEGSHLRISAASTTFIEEERDEDVEEDEDDDDDEKDVGNTTGATVKPQTKKLKGGPPVKDATCSVCSDGASGFHYGVFACEGCKGFFRRCLVHGTSHIKCQVTGDCLITPTTRNACQSCRYAKCVTVGMSKEASRLGRRPKKIKIEMTTGEAGPSSTVVNNVASDIPAMPLPDTTVGQEGPQVAEVKTERAPPQPMAPPMFQAGNNNNNQSQQQQINMFMNMMQGMSAGNGPSMPPQMPQMGPQVPNSTSGIPSGGPQPMGMGGMNPMMMPPGGAPPTMPGNNAGGPPGPHPMMGMIGSMGPSSGMMMMMGGPPSHGMIKEIEDYQRTSRQSFFSYTSNFDIPNSSANCSQLLGQQGIIAADPTCRSFGRSGTKRPANDDVGVVYPDASSKDEYDDLLNDPTLLDTSALDDLDRLRDMSNSPNSSENSSDQVQNARSGVRFTFHDADVAKILDYRPNRICNVFTESRLRDMIRHGRSISLDVVNVTRKSIMDIIATCSIVNRQTTYERKCALLGPTYVGLSSFRRDSLPPDCQAKFQSSVAAVMGSITAFIDSELRRNIQFCSMLPGLCELSHQTIIDLLKQASFKIMLIRLIYSIDFTENAWVLDPPMDNLVWMEDFGQLPIVGTFTHHIILLKKLILDHGVALAFRTPEFINNDMIHPIPDEVQALVCAIVLICSDTKLINTPDIRKLESLYIRCLSDALMPIMHDDSDLVYKYVRVIFSDLIPICEDAHISHQQQIQNMKQVMASLMMSANISSGPPPNMPPIIRDPKVGLSLSKILQNNLFKEVYDDEVINVVDSDLPQNNNNS